jgi:hypothetical protein
MENYELKSEAIFYDKKGRRIKAEEINIGFFFNAETFGQLLDAMDFPEKDEWEKVIIYGTEFEKKDLINFQTCYYKWHQFDQWLMNKIQPPGPTTYEYTEDDEASFV